VQRSLKNKQKEKRRKLGMFCFWTVVKMSYPERCWWVRYEGGNNEKGDETSRCKFLFLLEFGWEETI